MRQKLIAGEKGAAIVEVTVAILLLGIMIAGLSQLLTSQIRAHQDYMKEQLALMAVSNQMERLICLVKDGEWGGSCPTTAIEAVVLSPSLPTDLHTICPDCQMNWSIGCVDTSTSADNWLAEVWISENTNVQASLTRHVYH
jgi:type II secretory pathway pseudopilin PulG